MARFYITTAISYTNAKPHIGHALELVQADAIARYRRMMGDEVYFLTGTDEHGTKIQRAAQASGSPSPEVFVDDIAKEFITLAKALGASEHDFIRTSDKQRHWPGAQKIWKKLAEQDDLYKKKYEGYYCVGHEAFIKQSELIEGKCPIHKTEPENVQEENWFFRLSKYKNQIEKLISGETLKIVPSIRKSEILNLLKDAEDVSFSRPSDQLSWGIPVPGDASQTMYVWADALTNYISALGYGTDEKNMLFWPAEVHLIGKDIVRFHAIYWPAMLLSAGLAIPKSLYVHGFITVDGEKMSKSLGNVIDPFALVDRYGVDVVRYYMLRELQSTDDSDFSFKNLENRYNSDLANGLGNLVQRVGTLIESTLNGTVIYDASWDKEIPQLGAVLHDTEYHRAFEQFRLHDAAASVWSKIGLANAYFNKQEPWKQEGEERQTTLGVAATMVAHIAWLLQPLMPDTSAKISETLNTPPFPWKQSQKITVKKGKALFPRRQW